MIRLSLACLASAVLGASAGVSVTFKAMSDLQPVVVAAPQQAVPDHEPAPGPTTPDQPDLTDVFAVQMTAPSGQTDFDVARITVGNGEPYLAATPSETPWTFVLRRSGGSHVVIVANP